MPPMSYTGRTVVGVATYKKKIQLEIERVKGLKEKLQAVEIEVLHAQAANAIGVIIADTDGYITRGGGWVVMSAPASEGPRCKIPAVFVRTPEAKSLRTLTDADRPPLLVALNTTGQIDVAVVMGDQADKDQMCQDQVYNQVDQADLVVQEIQWDQADQVEALCPVLQVKLAAQWKDQADQAVQAARRARRARRVRRVRRSWRARRASLPGVRGKEVM